MLGDPAFLIALISASGEGRRPACGETQRRSIAAITGSTRSMRESALAISDLHGRERERARAPREREGGGQREQYASYLPPPRCRRPWRGGAGTSAKLQCSSRSREGRKKKGETPKTPKTVSDSVFSFGVGGTRAETTKPTKDRTAPHGPELGNFAGRGAVVLVEQWADPTHPELNQVDPGRISFRSVCGFGKDAGCSGLRHRFTASGRRLGKEEEGEKKKKKKRRKRGRGVGGRSNASSPTNSNSHVCRGRGIPVGLHLRGHVAWGTGDIAVGIGQDVCLAKVFSLY